MKIEDSSGSRLYPLKNKAETGNLKLLAKALDNMKEKQEESDSIGLFQPTTVSKEELRKTIEKLNHTVDLYNKQIMFELHEDTNVLMARVVNRETNEVITQLPPEELLDVVAKIKELVGALIDKRV
jgi:uncharacterized FlaG/YvyC family protein